MAKTNWKYKVIEQWSCPRSGAKYTGPEVAADIGVYEKDKLLTVITVMGLNNTERFPDEEALKKHLRMRAREELAAQAKREEEKEAAEIPVMQDIVDSFDPTKLEGPEHV